MRIEIQLKLSPEEAYDKDVFHQTILKSLDPAVDPTTVLYRLTRRSIDARSRKVIVHVTVEVFIGEKPPAMITAHRNYPPVGDARAVIIVGAGPAGLFAALRAIELGYKPIILERGKDVRSRRRDLAAINKEHLVNPDSNYCFGEGGAGTYSDGKLYTRSKKRGDIRRILEIFVAHGATEKILVDAHPHIGTNKLPLIVTELRNSIIKAGGEVNFDTKVVDFVMQGNEMKGVIDQHGREFFGIGVILATGHSARDIYRLLLERNIRIEAKSFALGVRIEHAQPLIDKIQYHCEGDRGDYLPASTYSLVHQSLYEGKQRGVFSFCMCPGGFIVPSATAPGEVVVNGMSPSRRDSKFANSGIVVSVETEDLAAYEKFGPLAAMEFQAEIERKAWKAGGRTQTAPAQRMVDFVEGRISKNLLETSYQPGLHSVNIDSVLPPFIGERLKDAFRAFDKKMKGYFTNDAQIVGVESRTSSPVRVPRDRESFEHPTTERLFPCGEGAGYAGGIVSAAMDGERCAEKLIEKYGLITPSYRS